MKKEEPDRYLRLEHWLQKGATIDPRDLYPAGSSKEKRRAEIANMLIPEVGLFLSVVLISPSFDPVSCNVFFFVFDVFGG